MIRNVKRVAHNLLNLPRYGAAALHDPQHLVDVFFHGAGEPMNVTRNNVVAALRPFTLGLMFDFDAPDPGPRPRLAMHDHKSNRLLGEIDLRPARTIELPGHQFRLFEAADCRNFTASPAALALYYARERWRAARRQRKNPFNFLMTTTDLHCSYVFYICPRPVVLVTVAHQGASNMFPMDLIGPTTSPWFSMALRSTSPAVKLMQQSRRMALASVPFRNKEVAYDLARYHRLETIDLKALPFDTIPSPTFGLPTMRKALRVREVRVEEFHEVGSHVLFVTSLVKDLGPAPTTEPQLFHAFSAYRESLGHTLA